METQQTASARPITSRDVVVLGPGQGEDVWFLDTLLTIKAHPRTGSEFSVVENTILEVRAPTAAATAGPCRAPWRSSPRP